MGVDYKIEAMPSVDTITAALESPPRMNDNATRSDVRSTIDPASEFQAFVEPYWPAMARFARHVATADTWEDVLQDALTSAWRKRRQYNPAKGSPRNWLFSIVADRAYKTRRRKSADSVPLEHDVGYAHDHTAQLDLREAISRLAPRQRLVVTLRYYQHLSTEETAKVMNCSAGTVTSTLSDAKRQLKQLLGEDYNNA